MVRTETKRNLLFIAVGILMNIVGSYMAEYWDLPIYLDSTGTIFTSAACGLAGIFTGLFTNLIKCIWDSSSIYYIAINVLIAVATALLIKKRAVIALIPILTFIGGFLGNWITAILYNKNFFSTLKLSLLYDFIDKTIQQALIPRSILIVLLAGISILMTIAVPDWADKWWLLFGLLAIALFIALPSQLRFRSFAKIFAIPGLVLRMLKNILHMDRKNTDFIHTEHNS